MPSGTTYDVSDRPPLSTAEILAAIKQAAPPDCDVFEVHSSLSLLSGLSRRPHRWAFLRAVRSLVREGKTLLFPAFTFSYAGGKAFHLQHSPSETGVLADWVLSLPEARRTPSPMFSFVVIGPKLPLFLQADHRDAWSAESVLSRVEKLGGGALMLGAGWDYLSFLHVVEQRFMVPYREFKVFHAKADLGQGPVDPAMQVYVRRRDIRTELDFAAGGRAAEEAGLVKTALLGEGEVKFVSLRHIARLCQERMGTNPFFLLKNGQQTAMDIAQVTQRTQQPVFRIALLSAENPDYLIEALKKQIAATIPTRSIAFYPSQYGNFYSDLTLDDSPLRTFNPHLTIIADTFESLSGCSGQYAIDEETFHLRLNRWHAAVAGWAEASENQVAVFRPMWATASGTFSGEENSARLATILAQNEGIFIDTPSLAAQSAIPLRDPRSWYLARTPWSPQFAKVLAEYLTGIVLDRCGLSVRLIVVDLDNTLWGGVATDDGLEGLALGGDFPGNAFRDFQLLLKSLVQRGIGLAIASKNDRHVALDILDRHPEMVLRREDFADEEIHWEAKTDSVVRLAKRMHLSLSSVMFLDDNPVEREAVRRNLPEVVVPELGNDPVRYCEIVSRIPQLASAGLTSSDRQRGNAFRQLKAVEDARRVAVDSQAFISDLAVTLRFALLNDGNLSRAGQLMTKTNQFNTTLKRYSAADLKALVQQGHQVIVLEIADKFNPPEIMGVAVLQQAVLDTVVLSCRAFGKGVETALFQALAAALFRQSGLYLRVCFTPTDKNHVVISALEALHFTPHNDIWLAGTKSLSLPVSPVKITGLEEIFQ